MSTRRVINRIATSARGTAFQPRELRRQSRQIQQLDFARVQERQHVAVDFALRAVTRLILNATPTKPLPWPLPGVAIAGDATDAIVPEQRRKLGNHGLGREWRPHFAYRVQYAYIALRVSNCERHRISRAAAGIYNAT
jgi:hypothetical protein